MSLKNFVFVFFIFLSLWCSAQKREPINKIYDPDTKYSANDLRSDFIILRKVLEDVHPGLYAYTSKKEYDRLFDSIYASLNQEMTAMQFRLALLPLIKASHCEHTYTDVSDAYDFYLKHKALQFPLTIRIFNNGFYIDHNFSRNASLKKGDRILEINGKSSENLIKDLLYTEGADGYNETKLWWSLAHDFRDKYIDFEDNSGTFKLVVMRAGSTKPETIMISGLTMDTIEKYKNRRYINEIQRPKALSLTTEPKKGFAVLTIHTFNPGIIGRSDQDFTYFMNSSIHTLDSLAIPNLVIDLRNNKGGRTQLGMELYSHFSDKNFTYMKTIKQKSMRHFKYYEYCEADTDCFKDSSKFIQAVGGYYVMKRHELMGEQSPSKTNYSGNIYILTNGGTMSAAAFFCDIVYKNKRAVFIGEEVGGSYTALNGNAVSLILPKTGVAMNIPTRRFEDAVGSDEFNGHGVQPDFKIKPDLSDFINGKDPEMDFVIDKICHKN